MRKEGIGNAIRVRSGTKTIRQFLHVSAGSSEEQVVAVAQMTEAMVSYRTHRVGIAIDAHAVRAYRVDPNHRITLNVTADLQTQFGLSSLHVDPNNRGRRLWIQPGGGDRRISDRRR